MMITNLEEIIKRQYGKFNKDCLLRAPLFYWDMTNKFILDQTNGMGPECFIVNAIPEKFRNNLLGLSVAEAAYIHDICYGFIMKYLEGKTNMCEDEVRYYVDFLFVSNLKVIVNTSFNNELHKVKRSNSWKITKKIKIWWLNHLKIARLQEANKCLLLVRKYGKMN